MQKNEWVAQTKESDTILRSMNACFILINSDLVVIRTNYYDLSGISEEPASSGRVGDLLNCKTLFVVAEDAGHIKIAKLHDSPYY